MQILMFSILFTSLLISLCLLVAFIHLEGRDGKGNELIHLVFFPYTGWGAWVYERKKRMGLSGLFTREYHIFQRMGFLGLVMSLGLLVAVFLMWSESLNYIGEGMEWAEETDNASMIGVGFLGDLLIGAGTIIYGVFLLVLWFFVALVIIVLPFFLARSSKRRFYFDEIQKENEELKSRT